MDQNPPTPEQLAKLPKWAQEHIADLERRVVLAERTLQEYNDSQTPSEFFYEDFNRMGGNDSTKSIRRYIQTYRMTVERDGVQVDVLLRQDDPGIEISFSSSNRLVSQVAMVAASFNKIIILPKDKLR